MLACGAFRDAADPRCRKCRCRVAARTRSNGEVIPGGGPGGAGLSASLAAASKVPVEPEAAIAHELPDDFLARVRRLPSQTMVRVPAQFRYQLCEASAPSPPSIISARSSTQNMVAEQAGKQASTHASKQQRGRCERCFAQASAGEVSCEAHL